MFLNFDMKFSYENLKSRPSISNGHAYHVFHWFGWSFHLLINPDLDTDLDYNISSLTVKSADQSSVYQTYLRSSSPFSRLTLSIDHAQTDTYPHLKRFWLTSVRSMWICFVSKPCSGNRIQFTIRKYKETAPANQRMIGAKPDNQTAFDLDLEVSGCFTIHVYLMHYSSESERSIWWWVSSESELV